MATSVAVGEAGGVDEGSAVGWGVDRIDGCGEPGASEPAGFPQPASRRHSKVAPIAPHDIMVKQGKSLPTEYFAHPF